MVIPQRTCIGCYQVKPKGDLIRIVRSSDDLLVIDAECKKHGRGVYICPDINCVNKAVNKDRLFRALRIASDSFSNADSEVIEKLKKELLELIKGWQNNIS